MSSKLKVCILGFGNWGGSAIAKIIGSNAARLDSFDSCVKLWVNEEKFQGKKLTEIINTTHENLKYLPGIKLPENVVAVSDIAEAAKDADILVFVVSHQSIPILCYHLKEIIKPTTATALSLLKGFHVVNGGRIALTSQIIQKHLKIEVSVLVGAHLAREIADENFCETTIGCKDKKIGQILKDLIQTDYFRASVVDNVEAVEICGALKNIVAVGAGFIDGLKLGENTKVAIIRIGLMEMMKFVDTFYTYAQPSIYLESCGVADLMTACYSGRNKKLSEAYVTSGKTIKELEKELLNGKKIQGPVTAAMLSSALKDKNKENDFPLFTTVHKICIGELKPCDLIEHMKLIISI